MLIVVVANKIDSKKRAVSKEDGIKIAQRYEVDFVEVSAKTGESVPELFSEISKSLVVGIIPEETINTINFSRS